MITKEEILFILINNKEIKNCEDCKDLKFDKMISNLPPSVALHFLTSAVLLEDLIKERLLIENSKKL